MDKSSFSKFMRTCKKNYPLHINQPDFINLMLENICDVENFRMTRSDRSSANKFINGSEWPSSVDIRVVYSNRNAEKFKKFIMTTWDTEQKRKNLVYDITTAFGMRCRTDDKSICEGIANLFIEILSVCANT